MVFAAANCELPVHGRARRRRHREGAAERIQETMRFLTDDAVLLSAADELACEEEQRAPAAVDQYASWLTEHRRWLWKVHGAANREPRTMLSEPCWHDGHVGWRDLPQESGRNWWVLL